MDAARAEGDESDHRACDARQPCVFDIADKELNALIGEVADGGATVVSVFDSCHSGGATRDVDPAVTVTAPARGAKRTLDDYLERTRDLYDPARVALGIRTSP